MRIIFKKLKYGTDKDNVIAVDVDSKFGDYYQSHSLFDTWKFTDKECIQKQTCNATPKEYLSLLTKLKKDYKEIEIVNSLKIK